VSSVGKSLTNQWGTI